MHMKKSKHSIATILFLLFLLVNGGTYGIITILYADHKSIDGIDRIYDIYNLG